MHVLVTMRMYKDARVKMHETAVLPYVLLLRYKWVNEEPSLLFMMSTRVRTISL